MLTDVDDLDALVRQVSKAQSHNARLQGSDLAIVTNDLARIARRDDGAALIAADAAGDRIIGAATVLHPTLNAIADTSQRLDGQTILLVSGMIAGSIGLMQTAVRLRSLGADCVRAAVLGGWNSAIPGIDELVPLGATASRGR